MKEPQLPESDENGHQDNHSKDYFISKGNKTNGQRNRSSPKEERTEIVNLPPYRKPPTDQSRHKYDCQDEYNKHVELSGLIVDNDVQQR